MHADDQAVSVIGRRPLARRLRGQREAGRAEMKENYISRKLIRQCQNVKELPPGY